MSDIARDLRRVASSSGLYAVASLMQRGLSFILLPVYTRFLAPADYGVLELLNGLSALLFGLLLLGMPSALTKVFHRDCASETEQRSILPTALAVDAPALLVGAAVLTLFAEQVGLWLLGEVGRAQEVRLAVAAVVIASLVAIVLSGFRAREQALGYAMLNFFQFGLGMLFNIALVVWLRLGIEGVLWGNVLSAAAALPLGLWMSRNDTALRIETRLVRPLLHFGLLVVPTAITGWIITMADRYVLRLYDTLETVAVYSVGYKIGMIVQLGVVWPFQLAWPAVAFSISKRAGHETTYARVLTYLVAILVWASIGLSLVAQAGLAAFAGPSYGEAYQVVPWVALAYSFAGLQYCLAPAVHIRGKTKYLPALSFVAAAVNLGLDFLWIPDFGIYGATWATTASYVVLAAGTAWLALRHHPIPVETGRLVRAIVVGASVFALGRWVEVGRGFLAALTWQLFLALFLFPVLLLASGFLTASERREIAGAVQRFVRRFPRG